MRARPALHRPSTVPLIVDDHSFGLYLYGNPRLFLEALGPASRSRRKRSLSASSPRFPSADDVTGEPSKTHLSRRNYRLQLDLIKRLYDRMAATGPQSYRVDDALKALVFDAEDVRRVLSDLLHRGLL